MQIYQSFYIHDPKNSKSILIRFINDLSNLIFDSNLAERHIEITRLLLNLIQFHNLPLSEIEKDVFLQFIKIITTNFNDLDVETCAFIDKSICTYCTDKISDENDKFPILDFFASNFVNIGKIGSKIRSQIEILIYQQYNSLEYFLPIFFQNCISTVVCFINKSQILYQDNHSTYIIFWIGTTISSILDQKIQNQFYSQFEEIFIKTMKEITPDQAFFAIFLLKNFKNKKIISILINLLINNFYVYIDSWKNSYPNDFINFVKNLLLSHSKAVISSFFKSVNSEQQQINSSFPSIPNKYNKQSKLNKYLRKRSTEIYKTVKIFYEDLPSEPNPLCNSLLPYIEDTFDKFQDLSLCDAYTITDIIACIAFIGSPDTNIFCFSQSSKIYLATDRLLSNINKLSKEHRSILISFVYFMNKIVK